MRTRPTVRMALASCWLLILVAFGCAPKADSSGAKETLVTEDVGGPIDAELSTEEDPRGRARSTSGKVLPAGFPSELPIPSGVVVVGHGLAEHDKSYVTLETKTSAASLAAGWASLMEAEGWSVGRSGEVRLDASKGGLAVTVVATPVRSGSRVRVVY